MMKNVKKLLPFLLLFFSVSLFAQNNDCVINYNLYKGDYNNKAYDTAYEKWFWSLENCPTLSVNIYKHGAKILAHKIEKATAATEKNKYYELLERVHNDRIKHFPDKQPAKVYCDLAHLKEDKKEGDAEVLSYLKKAFEINPTDMCAKGVLKYFDIIYEKNKEQNPQRIFDVYDEVGEGVEDKISDISKNINKIQSKTSISSKESRKVKGYQQIIANFRSLEKRLDAKIAAISTCENLIVLNKKYFESNKDNKVWLRRAVSRMYNKKCTDAPFYGTLVEAYTKADPSPEASVFYAGILMNKGQESEAMVYFKKAVDQESDSYKKASYLLRIAQIWSKKGSKVKARKSCYEALEIHPSMGKAYLLIASLYASSANSCGGDVVAKRLVYKAAMDKALRAKSVDPSTKSDANSLIQSFKRNLPSKKDLFVANIQPESKFKVGCWINETVTVSTSD